MRIAGSIAERTSADSVEIFDPFMGLDEEAFKKLAASILIVVPHRPSEGIQSSLFEHAGRWALLGTPVANVADEFAGFVELTRNGIVAHFLRYCKEKPEIEYLVMIDNDEAVKWDAPYKLAQWGKDVVSGVVCSYSRHKGGTFACVVVEDKFGNGRFPSVSRTKTMPAAGLKEILGCGTGLICIHKRVFEAILESGDTPFMIQEDVRKECMKTGKLKLSEDMAFSKRVRDLGFKQYVDFSVHAEHFKTVSVSWPKVALDPSLDASSWTVAMEEDKQDFDA